MMGEAKQTWTKNRHEFLQLVNLSGKAGCRARGPAFGAACTAFRALGWVERVTPAIGIKVRITELGVRALEAWDAGKRGELDLRTDEEQRQDTLQLILRYSEVLELDVQLLRALLQRMPLETVNQALAPILEYIEQQSDAAAEASRGNPDVFKRVWSSGGMASSSGAGTILERGVETIPKDHPMARALQGALDPALGQATITMQIGEVGPLRQGTGILRHVMRKPPAEQQPADPKAVTITVRPDPREIEALETGGSVIGPRPFLPKPPAERPVPVDTVAARPTAEDEEDMGARHCICPKCSGRGTTGPMHLDCTRCKGRGHVLRLVSEL